MIILVLVIVIGSAAGCCFYLDKQKKSRKVEEEWNKSDEQWIERGVSLHDESVFVDGKYRGYFVQNGLKTDFHDIFLHFNKRLGEVMLYDERRPSDAIGSYSVTGKFKEGKSGLTLQKHYISGTGNPSQNLGHTVKTRLRYNRKTKEFWGIWIVNTFAYQGTGKFYVWLTETRPALDDIEGVTIPINKQGESSTETGTRDSCSFQQAVYAPRRY